jgi:hypothetical protein
MSNILHAYVPKVKYNKIQGKPYVTVSAKGISNGLSDTYNDGADFGPDTMLNATSPNQYGPPYTQTTGIQEAINYAKNTGELFVRFKSGLYTINSQLSIPSYIGIDFSDAQVKLSSSFSYPYAIQINGQFVKLYNLSLNMNNVPNVGAITMSSSLKNNFAYLTMKNINAYNFAQGSPYNQIGIYLTGYDSFIENLQLSGNPTIAMTIESGADIYINNVLIINASSALQIFGSEHIFLNNIDLDSNGSQYAQSSIMIIDTSHSILINNLSIWFNSNVYNYQNYSGSVGLQIGTPNTSYTSSTHNSDIVINNLNIIDANVTYGLTIYDGIGLRIKGFIGNPPLYTTSYPINTGISFGTNSTATIQYSTIDIDYYNLQTIASNFPPSNNYNTLIVRPPYNVTTPTVPASGTAAYNYNPFPVLVHLYNGSVTEIQVTKAYNGVTYTVFSSSSGTALVGNSVRLDPGDSITITYSTAPSWTWLPIV